MSAPEGAGPEGAGPAAAGERLGVLGGTFDPPHAGHLAAARAARDVLGLHRLLLVVANEPWQKTGTRPITPAADRLAMVEAAVADLARVEASSLEIDRGGPSYTIETVEALRGGALAAGRPAPEVFVVVGADLVGSLPTWERADELAELVTLAVVTRPPVRPLRAPAGWTAVPVPGPGVDVSSSQVRALLADGADVTGLVPPAVVRCIRRRGLYAVGR